MPKFERSALASLWAASFVCGVGATSLTLACSSDSAQKAPEDECKRGCPSYHTANLMSPSVSFASDVFPIFTQHCNDDLCHGNAQGSRADLYLGPELNASNGQISAVYEGLMRASKTAPAVMVVAPGDPAQSFLMNKVEGCQNKRNLQCYAEPNLCRAECGDPMPPLPRESYPELGDEDKMTLRRWIAQGALP